MGRMVSETIFLKICESLVLVNSHKIDGLVDVLAHNGPDGTVNPFLKICESFVLVEQHILDGLVDVRPRNVRCLVGYPNIGPSGPMS